MPSRLDQLLASLPLPLQREMSRMRDANSHFVARLGEVRLRAGHHAALTLDGRNYSLPIVLDKDELSTSFSKLCDNSVYAHTESLRAGYITAFGFRVGVAGRVVTEGGRILSITDIGSLCIRISHHVPGAGDSAVRVFWELGARAGLLVYSPPGVGKTTLLRDLAYQLSRGERALRVALIDTRAELYDEEAPPACQLDVLRACPMAEGIEMATRTLSPQVIICDEIGSEREASAVLSAARCGIPILASAHAASVDELYARPPLRRLLEAGMFGACVGIARTSEGFAHTVTKVGERVACFV